MTRAVLEAEGESEARKTAATVPSSALAVPASLHASLMARLDRLGTAKEIAQIGAAIGREFSYPLGLADRSVKSSRHLTVWSRQACCSSKDCPLMERTCSNMRSCRMPLMARFCASRDARCTPASQKGMALSSKPAVERSDPGGKVWDRPPGSVHQGATGGWSQGPLWAPEP